MAEQLYTTVITSQIGNPLAANQPQQGELQFLVFPLNIDTSGMLPVNQLAEVLTLTAGQVIPIPDMDAWVLGVYNWRGEILWVIDLAQLLGLPPLYQQAQELVTYKVIVSQGQHLGNRASYLGLAVKEVEDMHWCNPGDLASPPTAAITPGLAPYLRGYALGNNGEMLMALDAAAIFDRMLPSN